METIDITTSMGIALLAGLFTQAIKNGYAKTTITDKIRKIMVILTVLGLCLLFSWLTYFGGLLENDTLWNMFMRAGQATFITIGGYEGLKQLVNLFISDESSN